ncbi:MAG: LacI family DNA-binding transcriptional regulator [Nocardioidaceae bacterium]
MAPRKSTSVTMSDVAEAAGVSRALVSIVMRDAPGASAETRAHVRRVATEMGYQLDHRARLLRRSRTRTIGVAFQLRGEFHTGFLERLYNAAVGSGYELIISPHSPNRTEATAVQDLLAYRCESVILIGPHLRTSALDELAAQVPVVVVARSVRTRSVDVVRTDDVQGAKLAVDHLVSLGHRDIAHVHAGDAGGSLERRRGYQAAMRRHGLADHIRLVGGGLVERDGERAAKALLEDGLPTAVCMFNDSCAVGLMSILRLRGVDIPGRLSVTGFDDASVAGLESVSLTTVAQDTSALAAAALDRAITRIESRSVDPAETVVPPRLVVRSTTAAPSR